MNDLTRKGVLLGSQPAMEEYQEEKTDATETEGRGNCSAIAEQGKAQF